MTITKKGQSLPGKPVYSPKKSQICNGQEHSGQARLIGISPPLRVAKAQSFKFFLSGFAALRELDLHNISLTTTQKVANPLNFTISALEGGV